MAAAQAKLIEASTTGADSRAIDLLFLLQESVLVFGETHAMLEALAKREAADDRQGGIRQVRRDDGHAMRSDGNATRFRPLILAAKVAALLIVWAFVIELVDPAPIDVLAFWETAPHAQSHHDPTANSGRHPNVPALRTRRSTE